MSLRELTLRRYKNKLRSAAIVYKSVELSVYYRVSNDSFDHEFGTLIKPDHCEIESVCCGPTDITEILLDTQIEDLTNLLNEEFSK